MINIKDVSLKRENHYKNPSIKDRPLTVDMVTEFEKCYGNEPNGQAKRKNLGEEGRFRKFSIAAIKDIIPGGNFITYI